MNTLEHKIREATKKPVKYTEGDKIFAFQDHLEFKDYKGIHISLHRITNTFRVVRVDRNNTLGPDLYDSLSEEYVEVGKSFKLWWPVRGYKNLISGTNVHFLQIQKKDGQTIHPGLKVNLKYLGGNFVQNDGIYSISLSDLPDYLKDVHEFKEHLRHRLEEMTDTSNPGTKRSVEPETKRSVEPETKRSPDTRDRQSKYMYLVLLLMFAIAIAVFIYKFYTR